MSKKTPEAVASNDQLGQDPERTAFEAWWCKRWEDGRDSLRRRDMVGSERLSEYVSGHVQFAWEAWQGAATATRENCAEHIEVLVCECCHKESEVEFARYLAGEIRGA